jgi:putative hydrolase of the HAD superfamily
MLRAVLFDLDDTLFDHRQGARMALTELYEAHEAFRARTFPEFERMHARFLEELHGRVIAGELALDVARRERFRRLFAAVGVGDDDELVAGAAETYRVGYKKVRRPIAGAVALLQLVKQHARIAIVSNNLLDEQQEKLRMCELDACVDVLIVSEEAGVSKPDPAIFRLALERLDCDAADAIMVGDSWAADVIGALSCGIPPLWFNPLRKTAPDPDAGVPELHSLEPAHEALAAIRAAAAAARLRPDLAAR